MAAVVTEHCVKCKYTECCEACPTDAFHEGPDQLYINPDTCIDCDTCIAACPVGAIYTLDEVPERYKSFIQINADGAAQYPVIASQKAALPSALTMDEWKAKDIAKYGSA